MKSSIHASSGRYFIIMRFITFSHPHRKVENVPSKSHTMAFMGLFMSMKNLLKNLRLHSRAGEACKFGDGEIAGNRRTLRTERAYGAHRKPH